MRTLACDGSVGLARQSSHSSSRAQHPASRAWRASRSPERRERPEFRDQRARHSSQGCQSPHVRSHPVEEVLAPARFRVLVLTIPKHRHEQLHLASAHWAQPKLVKRPITGPGKVRPARLSSGATRGAPTNTLRFSMGSDGPWCVATFIGRWFTGGMSRVCKSPDNALHFVHLLAEPGHKPFATSVWNGFATRCWRGGGRSETKTASITGQRHHLLTKCRLCPVGNTN